MAYNHVMLFNGHMIDAPTRKTRRFPADMEAHVAAALRAAVGTLVATEESETLAIAGGARGGDLLFLEACRDRGISRRMVIGRPFEEYRENFARNIPGNWPDRADDMWRDPNTEQDVCIAPPHVHRYQFVNDHMLETAIGLSDRVTLVVLWDKVKRGKGGPSDFMERASGKAFIQEIDFSELARGYWASKEPATAHQGA